MLTEKHIHKRESQFTHYQKRFRRKSISIEEIEIEIEKTRKRMRELPIERLNSKNTELTETREEAIKRIKAKKDQLKTEYQDLRSKLTALVNALQSKKRQSYWVKNHSYLWD